MLLLLSDVANYVVLFNKLIYSRILLFILEKKNSHGVEQGVTQLHRGNRNPLLYKNINVDGLKMIFDNPNDRYQLASSMYLTNNNDRLIVVGSGFKDKNDRSRESSKLLTFGKTNYHTFKNCQKS